ncbi:MAG TPA: M28 family peptidase [Terriglobia bacterium]|nr:M28 family peptidase [Terriglobia bacterium]
MSCLRWLICAVLCLVVSHPSAAQESPFLPQHTYDKLTNEISGDIAYDNLRSLVMYHAPSGGSEGFRREAQWVLDRAKSYGLEDARFIPLPAWITSPKAVNQNWTLRGGELWLVEPKEIKLGDVRETPTSVADNSPSADITAEMVDVGEGTSEGDYTGKDVGGKVVLAYGRIDRVKEMACWGRGAIGIVSYYSSRVSPWTDFPDQVAWSRVSPSKPGEKPAPPVFMISPRSGLMLSRWMAGRTPSHIFSEEPETKEGTTPRFRVHLKIQSETTQPGTQGLVEGFIRGTTYHDQAIVLTAHLQEEKTSANDDRSGCASLLEIARALEALIADGRLPRPKRDIRFWWTNEIAAEYEYFAEHPEERLKIIADINQDMVGARQSLGGRVQQVSRTPYSRWSFLNDVVESIVTSLVKGNNGYLASWQNQNPAPYSRPIFSHLGSREPYRAEVVHYFDSTDHLVFNEGAIGIPAVTFTNWPDQYIHSTDDDLWQIDRTQLQRNAVAVAATALYLASLSDHEVPTLTAVIAGEARERISHDLSIGLSRLARAQAADRDAAYQDALELLRQAVDREITGLESLKRFTGDSSRKLLDSLIEDLKLTEVNHRKRIEEWYRALGGEKTRWDEDERERDCAAKVPRVLAPLGEYLKRKDQVEKPKGLHELMAFEAFNFIDGKRSILDIYHAVRAESLSAGEWYYGTVKLADIQDLFNRAAGEKAIEIITTNPQK